MWRLGMSLEDQCVFLRQRVEFAGIKAEVKNIYIKGKRVSRNHSADMYIQTHLDGGLPIESQRTRDIDYKDYIP